MSALLQAMGYLLQVGVGFHNKLIPGITHQQDHCFLKNNSRIWIFSISTVLCFIRYTRRITCQSTPSWVVPDPIQKQGLAHTRFVVRKFTSLTITCLKIFHNQYIKLSPHQSHKCCTLIGLQSLCSRSYLRGVGHCPTTVHPDIVSNTLVPSTFLAMWCTSCRCECAM